MAIFMKYGELAGGSLVEGYQGWGELRSLSWGFQRGTSMGVGAAAKREARLPNFTEVACEAPMSAFTALIAHELLFGKPARVVIHVTRAARGVQHVPFQIYTFTGAMVRSYQTAISDGAAADRFALDFARLDSEFFAMTPVGLRVSTGHVTYDIAAARP